MEISDTWTIGSELGGWGMIPVFVVAVVHVERDDAEAGGGQHRVESAATHRRWRRIGQPASPQQVQFVVEPIHGVLRLNIRRRKAKQQQQQHQLMLKSVNYIDSYSSSWFQHGLMAKSSNWINLIGINGDNGGWNRWRRNADCADRWTNCRHWSCFTDETDCVNISTVITDSSSSGLCPSRRRGRRWSGRGGGRGGGKESNQYNGFRLPVALHAEARSNSG